MSGRLFHGGWPHLDVGDLLLPSTTTGKAAAPYGGRQPDRVYLTEHLQVAAMFAAMSRGTGWEQGGAVYEVEPVGPVEVDPYGDGDYLAAQVLACTVGGGIAGEAGRSWMTPAARVVRVVARQVRLSPRGQAAAVEAAVMVGTLRELHATDPARYLEVLARTDALQDQGEDLRDALAGALAYRQPFPTAAGRSAAGDGDGWTDCGQGHRHWGRYGAAGLLVATDTPHPHVLLQHRAVWSDDGRTWGLPGGARNSHETAQQAAEREAVEETSLDPALLTILGTHDEDCGGWRYTTVVATSPGVLAVARDRESLELRWVPVEQVEAMPLHPALRQAWPALRRLLPEPAPPFTPAEQPTSLVLRVGDGELWQGGHECTGCATCPPLQDEWALVVELCPCAGPGSATSHQLLDIPDAPLDDEQTRQVHELAGHVARAVLDGGRVLVRCHWGLNRSGLLVGLALRLLGIDGPEAVELVRSTRSRCALRNGTFATTVKSCQDPALQG